jgi:acetate kinase
MTILVLNSGSSSLKFGLFRAGPGDRLQKRLAGTVRGLGEQARCQWKRDDGATGELAMPAADAAAAAAQVIAWLQGCAGEAVSIQELTVVGHRVVHGGDAFSSPVLLDERVLEALAGFNALAPLHNPPAIRTIRAARTALGRRVPMVAVFDTAFFQSLPDHARVYALPGEWSRETGAHRYGFHGIAHRYLYERLVQLSGANRETARVITLQLGQGCSVAAIRGAQPLDTSMGATPLEGLVMATRCGDIDPGLLLRLMVEHGLAPEQAGKALNQRAGLAGLSGLSGDMQELLRLESGHAAAALAVRVFCHRARKYLGAYCAVLGGVDAVVFGGGMGENAPAIRARICTDMTWGGLSLDASANERAMGTEARISANESKVAVYVIPVDEESVIARESNALVAGAHPA